jgi:hypothetical protein
MLRLCFVHVYVSFLLCLCVVFVAFMFCLCFVHVWLMLRFCFVNVLVLSFFFKFPVCLEGLDLDEGDTKHKRNINET